MKHVFSQSQRATEQVVRNVAAENHHLQSTPLHIHVSAGLTHQEVNNRKDTSSLYHGFSLKVKEGTEISV